MSNKKLLVLAVVCGVGVVLALAWFRRPGFVASHQPGLYHVSKFIDGDTIAVNMSGVEEHIRLIGVDTPETHDPRKPVQCYGWTAAAFTKRFLGKKPIQLRADPLDTNRDRYGRLLRYVYLTNGELLNEEPIKQGYGFAYTSFPFDKATQFKQDQRLAQQQKVGLWQACHPIRNKYGGYTSNAVSSKPPG